MSYALRLNERIFVQAVSSDFAHMILTVLAPLLNSMTE